MATGQREERQGATWYNVRNGELYDHKSGEIIGWMSGELRGVEVRKNDRFGNLELHVKLHDPDDGPQGRTYIVAGSLTNPDQTFQTWARMLIARLGNEANNIKLGDRICLEFYPFETDHGTATCCTVRYENDPAALPGPKIERQDTAAVRSYLGHLQKAFPWNPATALSQGSAGQPKAEADRSLAMPGLAAQLYGTESTEHREATSPGLVVEDDGLPF